MYGRRCNIILETLCRSSVGEINDKMRSVELPIKKITARMYFESSLSFFSFVFIILCISTLYLGLFLCHLVVLILTPVLHHQYSQRACIHSSDNHTV